MNKKKDAGIPKFVFGLLAIFVIGLLFGVIGFSKFLKARPTYIENHKVATEKINLWEDTLNNATAKEKEVEDLKKQYEQMREEVFINASKSIDDVNEMLLSADIALESITISEEAEAGGASSSGDPLYATTISFTCYAKQETLAKILNYFEQQSIGAYYINDMTVTTIFEDDESSDTSKPTDIYSVSMKVTLYYFKVVTDKK